MSRRTKCSSIVSHTICVGKGFWRVRRGRGRYSGRHSFWSEGLKTCSLSSMAKLFGVVGSLSETEGRTSIYNCSTWPGCEPGTDSD